MVAAELNDRFCQSVLGNVCKRIEIKTPMTCISRLLDMLALLDICPRQLMLVLHRQSVGTQASACAPHNSGTWASSKSSKEDEDIVGVQECNHEAASICHR